MRPAIQVLVVDDHPTFREGIRALLEDEDDIIVLAEANSVSRARVAFVEHEIDVSLIDLQLSDGDGEDLIAEFCETKPDAVILALTSHGGPETIKRTLAVGARGYILKSTARTEIVAAVRAAASGRRIVQGVVAERLAEAMIQDDLTAREMQVLRVAAEGLSNKEIARRLEITEPTVKLHIGNVLSKLGAKNRTEAILISLQSGLLRVR